MAKKQSAIPTIGEAQVEKEWTEKVKEAPPTFVEFENGARLEIKAVGQTALIQYFDGMGGLENFISEGDIGSVLSKLDSVERIKALKKINGMINYASGWGVIGDPSDIELKALAGISQYTGLAPIDRAMWVRFIVLEGDDSFAMKLLTSVIELSKD